MGDISNRDFKKFMVALVLSGKIEARDISEAKEKMEYVVQLFDFIEGLQQTTKIREL